MRIMRFVRITLVLLLKQLIEIHSALIRIRIINKVSINIAVILISTASSSPLFGQSKLALNLEEVIGLAKSQSIEAKQASTTKDNSYWQYKVHLSNYKPQLVLDGILPGYNRFFQEVIQPDGAVLFQQVQNNNSSLGLALEQNLAATGGTLFMTSRLQRFDDFDRNYSLYNSTLFALGIEQPLFGFNQLKWDKKMEPLKYEESNREYLEQLELIALKACGFYFDLLLSLENQQMAHSNLEATQHILAIAEEKLEVGKISRNELLQLKLELLKAQKALGMAKQAAETAALHLKSYIGIQAYSEFQLDIPYPQHFPDFDIQFLLRQAYGNRSDSIAFERRLLEAEKELQLARSNQGFRATAKAYLGFSNSAPELEAVTQSPQNYQSVNLQFSVPILDWGRSDASMQTAAANKKLLIFAIEQDRQNFEQQVFTQYSLFELLKEQLELSKEADTIALEKYQVAKDRYILGNLSVTDLSIASSEKDQARRDLITDLRDYWRVYYNLRYLTLYDFDKQEKIH